MGILNWLDNRLSGSSLSKAKYRNIIELTASTSWSLNREINKKAARGYTLCGAPVQGRDGVWRATMQLGNQGN